MNTPVAVLHDADAPLPPIPAKRYFTIGEVSDLCAVKPHVLRYWEQEFTQLRPMKRRGNRRYYQHHEVLLVRRIRELLYEQGFTISGARNRLGDSISLARGKETQVSDIDSAMDQTVEVSAADLREVVKDLREALEALTEPLPANSNAGSANSRALVGRLPKRA
jgi:DNA-binding transcriptional MerR regulator